MNQNRPYKIYEVARVPVLMAAETMRQLIIEFGDYDDKIYAGPIARYTWASKGCALEIIFDPQTNSVQFGVIPYMSIKDWEGNCAIITKTLEDLGKALGVPSEAIQRTPPEV